MTNFVETFNQLHDAFVGGAISDDVFCDELVNRCGYDRYDANSVAKRLRLKRMAVLVRAVAKTVAFDTTTGTWRVVAADGNILMDGFTSNAQAWAWIDAHCQVDQGLAAAGDRIRDAFGNR